MAIYLLQTLRRSKSTVYRIKNRLLLSSTPRKMSSGLPLQEVVNTLESYASSLLAESWDNVGLLVEPSAPMFVKKLFLTNDLTEGVLTEAVMKSADMVLSYHPPLFVPFKRIVQQKWKDRIIVKALENRIAIYSPHTSYDAVKGGVNDWLVSCFHGNVKPITPKSEESEDGAGRICVLHEPLFLDDVIKKLKSHLQLKHIRVALSQPEKSTVSTIASCAGSGASVLRGIRADAFITGEMSHHDVLDAVSNQTNVLLCEHSNSERGFLKILAPVLKNLLKGKVDVVVSETDRDPLNVV